MHFKKMCSHPLLGAYTADYLKLLIRNVYHFGLRQFFRLTYILTSTILISMIAWIEKLFYGRRIETLDLHEDPIFIIGHWRSGTTFLHYLLSKDQQFGFLKNQQAFMPNTMLVFKRFIHWLVRIHLFKKRPMDDVKLSADCPQEEEFALSGFGIGAYLGWYFPERLFYFFNKYVLFDYCSDQEIKHFKKTYKNLIKKIAFANGNKQLVLKNPANTARVRLLLELFPNAKFIYLSRNPYEVYHSTVKLHTRLTNTFGLGAVCTNEITDLVLDIYPRMQRLYQSDKHLIPNENLVELNYEQLVKHPIPTLKEIYLHLNISGFVAAKPAFRNFINSQKGYKAATYSTHPATMQMINRFWLADSSEYKATNLSPQFSISNN